MIRVSTRSLFAAGEDNVMTRQRALLDAQTRVSTGKRINSPADDPVGAAEGVGLRTRLTQLDQFGKNQDYARSVLSLAESTLGQFTDALHAVREKLVAAGNTAYTDSDRAGMAADLEGLLRQMVGLANSADGSGGFLFAGARETVAPFAALGNDVSFRGDDVLQSIEVAKDRFQRVKLSGDEVFLKMRAGNGSFVATAGAGNTGAAAIDAGAVVDPAALTGRPYALTIGGAPGALTYQLVRDDGGGATTVVSSGPYTNPLALNADGMQLTVTGTPAPGDSFSVAPAGFQSIFDTLRDAIAALRTPSASNAGRAQLTSRLSQAGAALSGALDHILLKRADLGSSLAELDAYSTLNDDRALAYETRLSAVEDVDMAQAISRLSREQATYQAALSSYSSISKLSLFNYL